MLSFVDPAHIRHLIQQSAFPTERKQQLLNQLSVAAVDDRVSIIRSLEQRHPGLERRLRLLWPHRSRAAQFVWNVPALAATPTNEIFEQLSSQLEDDICVGAECVKEYEREPSPGPHIRRVTVEHDQLHVLVHLVDFYEKEFFELEYRYPRVSRVLLNVPLSDGEVRAHAGAQEPAVARVETYAGYRKSLEALEGLLLEGLGFAGDDLTAYASTIPMSESAFKEFARRNKFEWIRVKGRDPTNRVGEIALAGHQGDDGRMALDSSVTMVSRQDVSENRERDYAFDFAHEDGFQEWVEFRVYFHRNPHLLFLRKTSLAAKQHLAELIFEEWRQ